jgi:arsenite methyltransferase
MISLCGAGDVTLDCSFNWTEIRDIGGPCVRPGGTVLTDRALRICNLPPGSRIVDIGCGAGGTLEHLERAGFRHAAGLDLSETLLSEAADRLSSVRLVRGRAEILPYKKGCFHALFCECVLSLLSDRPAALGECARVLKEGGVLIISDVFGQGGPLHGQPGEESQGPRTKGLLTKEDLLDLLERLGFVILLWEEHKRFLKEFMARMILSGQRLPDLSGCGQGQVGKQVGSAGVSYFLLVARKPSGPFHLMANKRDGTP